MPAQAQDQESLDQGGGTMEAELPAPFGIPGADEGEMEDVGDSSTRLAASSEGQGGDKEVVEDEAGVHPSRVAAPDIPPPNQSGFNHRCPYCQVSYESLTTDPSLRNFTTTVVSGARASVLHKWTRLVAQHVSHCVRAPPVREDKQPKEDKTGHQQAPTVATRRSTRAGKEAARDDTSTSPSAVTADDINVQPRKQRRPDGGRQNGGSDPRPAQPKRKSSQTPSDVGASRPKRRKQDAGALRKAAILNSTRTLRSANRRLREGEYDGGEGIAVAARRTSQSAAGTATTSDPNDSTGNDANNTAGGDDTNDEASEEG